MTIVVLDGYTVNPGDLNWEPIAKLGELILYDRTLDHEIVSRSMPAELLIVNKVKISREHMDKLPHLKAIFLLATGYDNIDVEAAKMKRIALYNAVGYSTESVAQHTMALILSFFNQVEKHNISVKQGDWSGQPDFSYALAPVYQLKSKTIGLLGFGKIGQRVAELCHGFGMNVIASTRSSFDHPIVSSVSFSDLLVQSDIISLHMPLTPSTRQIINQETLDQMKENVLIINTARGDLINEAVLLKAIQKGKVKGAALDVLSTEPPHSEHPFFGNERILITPHMAWRSVEARSELIFTVAENIQHFINGRSHNRVV
jgi:glycerate dehydrogenase